MQKTPPEAALPRPARLLATLLGAGRVPVAPGTAGSVLAVLPCLFLPDHIYLWALLSGVLLATLLSALIARMLPQDCPDPGWFVLDEAAGVWLALLWVTNPGVLHVVTALALFRLFDIWKPFPLEALEQVGGGLGIVLDDLGAGAYALALLLAATQLLA